MKKSSILIVENDDVGRIYKETIEDILNIDVFWAKNENEAINIIENNYIKVALLDQRLDAGELGTDVLEKLRKIQPNVIAIMLTGKAHNEEIGKDVRSVLDLQPYRATRDRVFDDKDVLHFTCTVLTQKNFSNISCHS